MTETEEDRFDVMINPLTTAPGMILQESRQKAL